MIEQQKLAVFIACSLCVRQDSGHLDILRVNFLTMNLKDLIQQNPVNPLLAGRTFNEHGQIVCKR